MPGVSHQVYHRSPQEALNVSVPNSTYTSPRNTLASSSGIVVAVNDETPHTAPSTPQPAPPQSSLSFDEEAKLVYGVVLSLRNMIKKLSGKYVGSLLLRDPTVLIVLITH